MEKNSRLAAIIKYLIYATAFMPLIIFSEFMSPFHFGKVVVFRSLVMIMAVFYIVLILKNREFLPKRTGLFWSTSLFMIAFGLSTLTSQIPYQSFWGTLERMGGWLSFVHFWAFFVMASAILKEKENWLTFVRLSIIASLLSSFYGFLQKTDLQWVIGSGGRSKIFGTIGNPALFAGYVIVNAFLALTIFSRQQTSKPWKLFSIFVFLINSLAIIMTGVRGSVLALIVGTGLFSFLYAVNFASRKVKLAANIFVIIVLLTAGILFSLRNTDFVKKSPYLSRYADISPTAYTVKTRFWAWRAGFDGFNDSFRDMLVGPGPENFNLPFSRHFYPKFFRGIGSETLFDRAHNQFLEVLFTMGIISFVAYLLIYIQAFRNIRIANFPRSFDKSEANVLSIGLFTALIAYMIHNFFIFDSSPNYLMFFLLLGFINLINTKRIEESVSGRTVNKKIPLGVKFKTLPALAGVILMVFISWLIFETNIKPARANFTTTRAIVASWNSQHDLAFEKFKNALSYDTFGKYEIRHRYAQYTLERYNSRKLNEEAAERLLYAVEHVKRNISEFPNDYLPYLYVSRAYILLGRENPKSPYNDLALENSGKALELSPTFVRTYYEVAQANLNKKDFPKAIEFFKKAIELNPDVGLSWWYLGVTQVESGDLNNGVKTVEKAVERGYEYYHSEADLVRMVGIYDRIKDYQKIAVFYQDLIRIQPKNPQYHASLAASYAKIGNIDRAVKEAKAAAEIDQSYEAEARAFVKNLGRSWPES